MNVVRGRTTRPGRVPPFCPGSSIAPMRTRNVADEIAAHPTTFVVGAHTVVVCPVASNGRWTLTVDGATTDRTFETEVDAWSEGVRTADRLDHPPPAGG